MMRYEEATPENIIGSMDAVIKKGHDARTSIKFFLGILNVIEREPERLKLALLDHIDRLVNTL